jgi:integrase/recombinase XerC
MDYIIPIPQEVNVENFPHSELKTISDEIERYFQGYSPQTIIAYRHDTYSYWQYINKPLQDTEEKDILKYIKMLENEGFSNATINRKIASLSKIMSIYINMKLMTYNPVQNLASLGKLYKPVDNKITLNVTRHDVEAVIANSRKKTGVIVKFLVNTGLRVSEMCGIKKEDLEPYNTEYMRIKIKGKGGKIRFIFISYELYQDVKNIYDGESIYLFASSSDQQLSRVNLYKQINRSFSKWAHKSGISPHSLRHFFATQKIVNEKKDYKAVSTYLGHSNPSLTMTYYVDSQLSPEETVIL